MTILNYNNIQYDVVYIDPTLAEGGDGTTPSSALKTIPTLVDNTCYIIRRTSEEYLVDMPQSKKAANLTHIMFLGMPREDSDFYPIIPSEVKEAWGNDVDTYANVRMNLSSYTTTPENSIVIHSTTLLSLVCENCYFFRDGNSGAANQNLSPMFYIEKKADATFNNCKFGYAQYDLDDDDYLNSNEDIATDTSKYPQYKCCSYFYATTMDTLTLKNCIINQVTFEYNTNSYNYRMFRTTFNVWNGCNEFLMDGCTLNILNRYQYTSVTSSQFGGNGLTIGDAYTTTPYHSIVKNCTINHIFCKANTTIKSLKALQLSTTDVEMENVKCNFKGMKNFNVSSLTFSDGTQIIYIGSSRTSIRVNNIICDMTKEGSLSISGAPVLYIWANYRPVGNPNSYIKNINIKFPSEPQKIIDYNTNVLHLASDTYCWSSDGGWADGTAYNYRSTGRTFLADNIVVEAYQAKGNALYMVHSNARADHIYGDINLDHSTLDVGTIKNYYTEGTAITTTNGSYLKCNEYIGNMERYTGKAQISSDHVPSIYVNKSNMLLFNEIVSTNNMVINSNSMMLCPNYVANGQMFARNTHTFAKSWSVTRTGSNASASLKFYNNTTSVSNPNVLTIGLEPFNGIEVLPSQLGKHILTCYLATKNFADDEKQYGSRNCWLDVIVPETTEDGVDIRHTYSSKARPWYVDNSSWSGDAGLETYKIEMPIVVKDLTKPINVKLNYKWVSTSGFVYIDPNIKLVAVD